MKSTYKSKPLMHTYLYKTPYIKSYSKNTQKIDTVCPYTIHAIKHTHDYV
jgi:hypothetical protein